ncbi:hypothetical protein MN116_001342 [Schistosoma mekongi]|uniref:Uncharacterized protein n=1 Tax=Schistosoma mekongi TaxID=38744 RepID=A0AAE1ZMG1_SCHME|nr:hypothetical protein MN116_001342 [Schistosoma mekongi]
MLFDHPSSRNLLRQANCKLEESIDILEDQLTSIEDEVNRAVRRGSKISSYIDLDEDSVQELEDYRAYILKLCRELESRIDQEGKAYYWATEIRKRALIELNYTYIPAPVSKHPVEKKEDEGDKLAKKTQ